MRSPLFRLRRTMDYTSDASVSEVAPPPQVDLDAPASNSPLYSQNISNVTPDDLICQHVFLRGQDTRLRLGAEPRPI